MLIATNSIILKRIPYSDTSIICRVFTEKYGKIIILAKGVLRPKNINNALLEPINHIHLEYYNKISRDVQIFKHGNFIHKYSNIKKNLFCIYISLAIVEIIDKTTLTGNSIPLLYRLTWRILDKLNHNMNNILLSFSFFLYQFSILLGFMPNIINCIRCKSKILKGGINKITGETICCECTNLNDNIIFIENGFTILHILQKIHLDEIPSQKINKIGIMEAFKFLDFFTQYHIEGIKQVKSITMVRNFINQNI